MANYYETSISEQDYLSLTENELCIEIGKLTAQYEQASGKNKRQYMTKKLKEILQTKILLNKILQERQRNNRKKEDEKDIMVNKLQTDLQYYKQKHIEQSTEIENYHQQLKDCNAIVADYKRDNELHRSAFMNMEVPEYTLLIQIAEHKVEILDLNKRLHDMMKAVNKQIINEHLEKIESLNKNLKITKDHLQLIKGAKKKSAYTDQLLKSETTKLQELQNYEDQLQQCSQQLEQLQEQRQLLQQQSQQRPLSCFNFHVQLIDRQEQQIGNLKAIINNLEKQILELDKQLKGTLYQARQSTSSYMQDIE
jgi:hypothetical protein